MNNVGSGGAQLRIGGATNEGDLTDVVYVASCWGLHWITARSRTVADAIAFMIIDLIIFRFHQTSHECLSLIPML